MHTDETHWFAGNEKLHPEKEKNKLIGNTLEEKSLKPNGETDPFIKEYSKFQQSFFLFLGGTFSFVLYIYDL